MAIFYYEQSKFQFEFIPASCSGLSYRDFLGKYNWTKLTKFIKEKAGNKCELCSVYPNGTYENRLEVHESYSYDDENNIVSISELITVCNNCHCSIHSHPFHQMFYYLYHGKDHLLSCVDNHIEDKNLLKMSDVDIIIVLEKLLNKWFERSLKIWKMDHNQFRYDNINYHKIPNFSSYEISKDRRDRFIKKMIGMIGWINNFHQKVKSLFDYKSLDRFERVLNRFESIILNDRNFDKKKAYLKHIEGIIQKIKIDREILKTKEETEKIIRERERYEAAAVAEERITLKKRERYEIEAKARKKRIKKIINDVKELKKSGFSNAEIVKLLK